MHLAIGALQQELDLLNDGSRGFDTSPAIDLSRCKSMKERLERIAVANGGNLNLAHALEAIMAAGVSRAKASSLRREIRKAITRNPQDWECVGPRIYRYKPFEDKGNEEP